MPDYIAYAICSMLLAVGALPSVGLSIAVVMTRETARKLLRLLIIMNILNAHSPDDPSRDFLFLGRGCSLYS